MRDGFEPGSFGQKRKNGYRTDIEAMAEQALLILGIPYIFEHKVSRYSVDFALPTLGIALECDGWQHFTQEGIAHDARRNAALIQEGWAPLHIADKLLRSNALSAIRDALHINAPQSI